MPSNKCPNCGAAICSTSYTETIECDYCRTKFNANGNLAHSKKSPPYSNILFHGLTATEWIANKDYAKELERSLTLINNELKSAARQPLEPPARDLLKNKWYPVYRKALLERPDVADCFNNYLLLINNSFAEEEKSWLCAGDKTKELISKQNAIIQTIYNAEIALGRIPRKRYKATICKSNEWFLNLHTSNIDELQSESTERKKKVFIPTRALSVLVTPVSFAFTYIASIVDGSAQVIYSAILFVAKALTYVVLLTIAINVLIWSGKEWTLSALIALLIAILSWSNSNNHQ